MAASSGALVQALIDGGVSPSAAKIIANALANAATPGLSQSRDVADATPTESLRLINADARRYQFTNLDYSTEAPYESRLRAAPGRYANDDADHPYKDAQPVTPVPPLSQAATTGGKYIDVQNTVADGAPLATVNLKIGNNSGEHLRINPATNSVDAVPLTFTSPQGFVTGTVSETNRSTQIELAVRQLQSRTLIQADGTTAGIWGWVNSAVSSVTAISNWMLTNFLSLTSAADARNVLEVGAYSTGTWTPTLICPTGTNPVVTYQSPNFGEWVRHGNWVYVTGRLILASLTSGGTDYLCIGGLPFPAVLGSQAAVGVCGWRTNWTTIGPDAVYTTQNNQYLVLVSHTATSLNFLYAANLQAQSDVIFSCHYRVA